MIKKSQSQISNNKKMQMPYLKELPELEISIQRMKINSHV